MADEELDTEELDTENDDDLEAVEDADADAGDDDKPDASEAEQRARAAGWVPEDEWDAERAERAGIRKPAKFLTPEEYLARQDTRSHRLDEMRNELGGLRSENADLKDRLERLDKAQRETLDLLRWQSNRNKTTAEREYERGLNDAKKRMREAVSDADPEAFDAAEAYYESLRDNPPDAPPEPEVVPEPEPEPQPERTAADDKQGSVDPETQAWAMANPWYTEKAHLQFYMNDCYNRVSSGKPHLSQTEKLSQAKRLVQDRFPEEFGMQGRSGNGRSSVDEPRGGQRPRPNSAQERFKRLPREDRAAFESQQRLFKQRGVDYTVDEFMQEYE